MLRRRVANDDLLWRQAELKGYPIAVKLIGEIYGKLMYFV